MAAGQQAATAAATALDAMRVAAVQLEAVSRAAAEAAVTVEAEKAG